LGCCQPPTQRRARSARNIRIKTLNQLRHLAFTAPDQLRERLRAVNTDDLGAYTAALRPGSDTDPVTHATKLALRTLGRRVTELDDELGTLDASLGPLAADVAPDLVDLYGVGTHTATILLEAAGDNPERIRTEAAWARLCASLRCRPTPARPSIVTD
jgi:transposase